MDQVFISIGSNLGDRRAYCKRALEEMAGFSKVLKVSSLYETEPVGNEDQPDFINIAAEITTDMSPHNLLRHLNEIEERLGRVRYEKCGPRTIDLDIIFYGDLILNDDDLIIPHPAAHVRQFVLEPICEIDPDLIYPGLGITVFKVLQKLNNDKKVVKLNKLFTFSQQ